eukprot:4854320-Amphidinium_carterae.1
MTVTHGVYIVQLHCMPFALNGYVALVSKRKLAGQAEMAAFPDAQTSSPRQWATNKGNSTNFSKCRPLFIPGRVL